MNQVKWFRISLLLLLALGLALPAFAQVRDAKLSDSQEPGSVIVFPKFISGAVLVDGEVLPSTEIEVGVVCPKGATCAERQTIKIRFHWVCPGDQTFEHKYICQESDFDLFVTVNGKLVFNPNGTSNNLFGNTVVPAAPCARGYLIGWVINTADQPIKYDGLIGDAVLRESASAVAAYNAIPIQGHPDVAHNTAITLGPSGNLIFDGNPGHYQAVTGKIYGDVRYANLTPVTGIDANTGVPIPPGVRTQTFLTLLTLDVHSNRPNLPTFVNLKFYNENERLVSTFTEFICWTEVPLTTFTPFGSPTPVPGINASLSQANMGSRKGVVVSGAAEKVAFGFGDEADPAVQAAQAADTAGPVTLLGIVDTVEYIIVSVPNPTPPPDNVIFIDGIARSYSYSLFNDSTPVATDFFP